MPLFKSKAPKKGETATATAVTTPNHFLTPQKIMLAQLPIFGGTKNESFNSFSHQIELQMNNDANNGENKLETMLLRLHGTAATSFIELITQNPSITFDEMKAAMKRQFPEPLNTSLHVLRKRKQYRNETLDEFADAIKSLVNKFFTNSRGYNERARNFQMIKYFAANLQQPIKQQLKKYVKSFKEMNEALLKAKQLQQSHQSHQRQRMTAQMSQLHLNQQQMTQPQNTQFFSRELQSTNPQSNNSQQMCHRQLGSNASREHQWQQQRPCQRENKNWQGRQF